MVVCNHSPGLATANEARVFVDIAAASVNADCCPNPNVVDPTRKANCYLYADGSVKSLGEAFSLRVVSEVVKTVFSYKNLKRAPGQSGALKRCVLAPTDAITR
ncbi:Heme peroxidase [Mycena kentingensis (nom. inval.)]|nr:Heme peroxidase [Mycena kentingensis (nom. inval.)]